MLTGPLKGGTAFGRAAFFILLVSGCGPVRPEIALDRSADGDRFVVRGLERAPDRFEVFRVGKGEKTPLFGRSRVEGDTLLFEPRFPLRPGLTYRAILEVDGRKSEASFPIPSKSSAPSTILRHVFPSGSVLPENLLKFYLHFSAPMSRGEARDRVHLVDSTGREVGLPFLELDEELWDGTGTRLTLFFDPGRIKRGLKPREEEGPVLEEGKSYTLVVDRGWKDAEGRSLKTDFRKPFRVIAPDDRQPDPKAWRIQAPGPGSRDPIAVGFGEPLDEAMLNGVLVVVDPEGGTVSGRIGISKGETRWQFIPDRSWKSGTYTLLVDTALEDLAGNSIGRPFEVDLFRRVDRKIPVKTLRLPFTVR